MPSCEPRQSDRDDCDDSLERLKVIGIAGGTGADCSPPRWRRSANRQSANDWIAPQLEQRQTAGRTPSPPLHQRGSDRGLDHGCKARGHRADQSCDGKPTVDRKCWRGSHDQQTLEHSTTGRYGLETFFIVRLAIFLFLATSASSYAQDRLNWPGIFEASTAAMTSMPHCFQTKTPALV